MRRINVLLAVAALLGCLVATRGTALASTAGGTISLYHLNANIPNRGVCVQMVPALPNTWACLWKTNGLYPEITELLLHGFLSQKSCAISWSTLDPNGNAVIEMAECR